jgi:nicotinamidase-related amidase
MFAATLICSVGKPEAAEIIASRGTNGLAVVVVDVQTGLFCADPPPFEAAEVIQRINTVTAKARSAGVPVFFIQHDGPADGNWLVPFSDGWNLHPDLERHPADVVIRKTTNDSFYSTTLDRQLRGRGVQGLVLMGYATEFCVDSTVRNADSKDFEIFLISDAHTTNDAPMLKAPLIRLYFNWLWGEGSSRRGIHLLTASQVKFSASVEPKMAGVR